MASGGTRALGPRHAVSKGGSSPVGGGPRGRRPWRRWCVPCATRGRPPVLQGRLQGQLQRPRSCSTCGLQGARQLRLHGACGGGAHGQGGGRVAPGAAAPGADLAPAAEERKEAAAPGTDPAPAAEERKEAAAPRTDPAPAADLRKEERGGKEERASGAGGRPAMAPTPAAAAGEGRGSLSK